MRRFPAYHPNEVYSVCEQQSCLYSWSFKCLCLTVSMIWGLYYKIGFSFYSGNFTTPGRFLWPLSSDRKRLWSFLIAYKVFVFDFFSNLMASNNLKKTILFFCKRMILKQSSCLNLLTKFADSLNICLNF